MIRRYFSSAAVAATALVLSACVTPITTPQLTSTERIVQLQALNDYRVSGGLGIWTDEQSMSARLDWAEQAGDLTVHLSGPMGIGNLTLISEPGVATLTRGQTTVSSGPSVDKVLQNGLGLAAPVPVQELRRWVRGLSGNAKSVVRDDQGKLSSLRFTDEQGVQWQARFLKYTLLEGLAVPALITATGGPYSVRLSLKNWQHTDASVVPEQTQSDTRLAIPQR